MPWSPWLCNRRRRRGYDNDLYKEKQPQSRAEWYMVGTGYLRLDRSPYFPKRASNDNLATLWGKKICCKQRPRGVLFTRSQRHSKLRRKLGVRHYFSCTQHQEPPLFVQQSKYCNSELSFLTKINLQFKGLRDLDCIATISWEKKNFCIVRFTQFGAYRT